MKPNLNYGWPHVTLGNRYGSRIWPYSAIPGRHDGFEKPIFAWIPSIAVSNLIISESQLFPQWQGDLLIASLISQSLYRVRLHEGRVMYVEQIEIGTRVRDIAQMPDGRIALLSDHDEFSSCDAPRFTVMMSTISSRFIRTMPTMYVSTFPELSGKPPIP